MTRRHLRNIERTDARRVPPHVSLERLMRLFEADRRDYVWPDAVETPTSITETGQDGDERAGSVSVEGGRDFDCCAARDRDVAEAVAHEREVIARWVQDGAPGFTYYKGARNAGEAMALAIRAGAHHKGADS